MSVNVGIDFGTSNSGVAIYDGQKVNLLPVDRQNIIPEVVKTILYITRDDRHYIGQEAVELYYRHNVNRPRRYVKKWAGELEFTGAEMYYVRDIYVYEDELKPGRLLQYIKTALRTGDYQGTQIFERYYELVDLITVYLRSIKGRAEEFLDESIAGVTLGRPVKFRMTCTGIKKPKIPCGVRRMRLVSNMWNLNSSRSPQRCITKPMWIALRTRWFSISVGVRSISPSCD